MFTREKKIYCGNKYLEIDIYNVDGVYRKKKRAKKENISMPKIKRMNDKNSKRYFGWLVETNFDKGDYHLSLTYSDENIPESLEDMKKESNNFIRRLRRKAKAEGYNEIKYIIVDEYSEAGRKHHHILLKTELPRDLVEACWKNGRANCDRIQPDRLRGLEELINYLSKDPKGKRRWRASLNLNKPQKVVKDSKIKKILSMPDVYVENVNYWENKYKGYNLVECYIERNEYKGNIIRLKMRKLE